MLGMARGVRERDHAAERHAEHDRALDSERLAEGVYVVGPLRERPRLRRAGIAAAVAAMVEIDDLGDIGQGGVGRLVNRMVEAGAAMKQEERRLFPHRRAVGDEFRALDIEEQPHAVHRHVHEQASLDL